MTPGVCLTAAAWSQAHPAGYDAHAYFAHAAVKLASEAATVISGGGHILAVGLGAMRLCQFGG
jgi:hypothetical protein